MSAEHISTGAVCSDKADENDFISAAMKTSPRSRQSEPSAGFAFSSSAEKSASAASSEP